MLLNFMTHESGGGAFSLPCTDCRWSWAQKKGCADSAVSGTSLEGRDNVTFTFVTRFGKGKMIHMDPASKLIALP